MPEFDIREWGSRRGFPMKIEDPDAIKRVTELLRRDLVERLADQSQLSQGRTVRRKSGYTEHAESQTA